MHLSTAVFVTNSVNQSWHGVRKQCMQTQIYETTQQTKGINHRPLAHPKYTFGQSSSVQFRLIFPVMQRLEIWHFKSSTCNVFHLDKFKVGVITIQVLDSSNRQKSALIGVKVIFRRDLKNS